MLLITFIILISAHCLHNTYVAAARQSFNKPRLLIQESIEDIEVPEACRELTYCTFKPTNYPQDIIKKVTEHYKLRSSIPQSSVEIENRNRVTLGEEVCESVPTYERVYIIRPNKDKPWRTVLQDPEQDLNQSIRFERCKNPNASCFKNLFCTSVTEYVCQQKYITFEFLVLKDKNEIERMKAELPSSCSCFKFFEFATRIGLSREEL